MGPRRRRRRSAISPLSSRDLWIENQNKSVIICEMALGKKETEIRLCRCSIIANQLLNGLKCTVVHKLLRPLVIRSMQHCFDFFVSA